MRNWYYIAVLIVIVLLVALGLWFGTPQPVTGDTFAGTIRRFATDGKTRTMLGLILVDIVTGIIKALRLRTFDAQQLARFYASNVVPYVLGYLLVWIMALLGLDNVLTPTMQDSVASIGFAMIGTTLGASIVKNLQAINAGVPNA